MARHSPSNRKKEKRSKKCFVISPIGDEGTEVRRRADQVLNHVIRPITEEKHSYETTRADDIPHPGMITPQIVEHLLHDDLVIADLTGSNPNVTYELAIRHMIRKPVIQIQDSSDHLPFDISDVRTIRFDYRFVDSMEECKDSISKQIAAMMNNPKKVDSPITHALNLLALEPSDNPYKAVIQQMQSDIQMIKTKLANLEPKGFHPVLVRRDEALEPFSGRTNLSQSGYVPGISQSGVIPGSGVGTGIDPGQSPGNLYIDPAGKPGDNIRLRFVPKETDSKTEK